MSQRKWSTGSLLTLAGTRLTLTVLYLLENMVTGGDHQGSTILKE
jgi:hypothetical protein